MLIFLSWSGGATTMTARTDPLDCLLYALFWWSRREGKVKAPNNRAILRKIRSGSQPPHETIFSQLKNGTAKHGSNEIPKLRRALAGPDNRKRCEAIEGLLGMDGVLRCKTADELETSLAADMSCHRSKTAYRSGERVVIYDTGDDCVPRRFPVSTEQRACEELERMIAGSDFPVIGWKHRFDAGAGIPLDDLHRQTEIATRYRKVAHIWPGCLNNPFQEEMLELCTRLRQGQKPVHSTRALLNLLREHCVLLVVHLPEFLDFVPANANANVLRRLLELPCDTDAATLFPPGHPPVAFLSSTRYTFDLVSIGKSTRDRYDREMRSATGRIDETLAIAAEERLIEMNMIRSRLVEEMGSPSVEDTGLLMSRVDTMDDGTAACESAPVHMKIRAIAAAREDARHGFLDPSGGFERLVGNDFNRHPDLCTFHREVSLYVDYLRERERISAGAPPKLDLLQCTSASLHWLSEDSLLYLHHCGEIEDADCDHILNMSASIHVDSGRTEGKRTRKFYCSLGAKATVQEIWQRVAPERRRRVHYKIARYLLESQNDKSRLPNEFPFEPHWGRSRIYFLGESIRHLIRSCDDVAVPRKAALRENMASVPRTEGDSCPLPEWIDKQASVDPATMIHYCYEFLFRQELNGERRQDGKRNLSRRHGAFKYAVELLTLMSDGQRIGRPHPCLHPRFHYDFRRECGLALLDVGSLHEARRCFAEMAEAARRNAAASEEAAEVDDAIMLEVDALLLGALVYFTEGDANAATDNVAQADALLWDRYAQRVPARSGERDEPNRSARKEFGNKLRQIRLREAQACYFRGEYKAVVDCIQALEVRPLTDEIVFLRDAELQAIMNRNFPGFEIDAPDGRIERHGASESHALRPRRSQINTETLHFKIAALRRLADQETDAERRREALQEPLRLCMDGLLRASGEGMHHNAIGLRIALAAVNRDLGQFDLAERIMDQAHLDLLRFGGSERTFLAFLGEASRLLHVQGRLLHGYATYLHPLIQRAHAKNFGREHQKALAHAEMVLSSLLEMARAAEREPDADAGLEWRQKRIDALFQHSRLQQHTMPRRNRSDIVAGPFFAYSISRSRDRMRQLATVDGIEKELARVQEQCALKAAHPAVPSTRGRFLPNVK